VCAGKAGRLEGGLPQPAVVNFGRSCLSVTTISGGKQTAPSKYIYIVYLSIDVHCMRFLQEGCKALGFPKFQSDI
jgi:hypothetical protein